MAADLNRCEFIGRLGRDPDTKDTKSGEQMVTFSIAVGESYTDKLGEKVKLTEWINCVCYRKLAEICVKYLVKGSHVYVSGKLNTRKYIGKDGTEKSSVTIILDTMQMLGSKFHQDEASAPKEDASCHEIDPMSDVPF
jgi:single-strand DNA-binding protein